MHDAVAPKRSLAEDLRDLARSPRELWILYVATFFEYVGIFSFLQTLPLWLTHDFGMSDENAGGWAATFSTITTLFVFLVGSIADSLGVRRTLIGGFAFAALTRLAMSLAPNQWLAIASLLSFALAYATISPVLQTGIQRSSTPTTRSFAFSLWYVSFNLAGTVIGPMIDGIRSLFLVTGADGTAHLEPHLVELPLLGSRMLSAHAAILGIGFVSATIGAVAVLFLRRDFEHRRFDVNDGEVSAAPTDAKKVSPLRALREAFGDRAFWRFMVMLGLLSLVRMMFQHMHFTWPTYVTRINGDDFPVGSLWSLNSLAILFLAPLGTAVTRGFKPFHVLLVGAFISSASPFILVFGSSVSFQLAMILTLTVGEALWSPRLHEYNVSVAPRGRESTYVSLASLPYFLAKGLVGPTSGFLLGAFCPAEGVRNPAALWGVIGLTTMLGPIGMVLLRDWITKKPAT